MYSVVDVYNSKTAKLLGKLNKSETWAITISKDCTLYSESEEFVKADTEWMRHEAVHKEQWKRYGKKFALLYLLENMSVGYENNKYEIEARQIR